MPVRVLYVTDPACPASWGTEPALRRVRAEFGDEVAFTFVMAGRARTFDRPIDELRAWLDIAADTGMPVDARVWLGAPPRSSHPACLGVKAAAEQGLDGPYLRRLREALALERRRADNADALAALASDVPGMDVERFGVDLQSNAIVEAFGADLEVARAGPAPRMEVGGEAVEPAALRTAVAAAGARPRGGFPPGPEEALRTFGRMATVEVAAVCDLPGPRAPAELWRLALEWRVRPELGGALWLAS